MAPKRRHTKESILEGSFNFIREKGYEKISARRIANYINASTAPIYSNFKSMNELEIILEQRATDKLKEILIEEMEVDDSTFLSVPLKYIEFSFDERNLFNQISKSKQSMKTMKENLEQDVYKKMIEKLRKFHLTEDLSDDKLKEIIFRTWLYTHGIASFLDRDLTKEENLKQAEILLEDSFYGFVYVVKNNFKKEVF